MAPCGAGGNAKWLLEPNENGKWKSPRKRRRREQRHFPFLAGEILMAMSCILNCAIGGTIKSCSKMHFNYPASMHQMCVYLFDQPADEGNRVWLNYEHWTAAAPLQLRTPAGQRSSLGWLRTWSGRYSRGHHCGQPTAMQIIHVKSVQCIKGASSVACLPLPQLHWQWDIAYTPAKGNRMWSRS